MHLQGWKMKKETFDQFWKIVVIPKAAEYTNKYPNYLSFDEMMKIKNMPFGNLMKKPMLLFMCEWQIHKAE